MKKKLSLWLPVVIWMTIIFYFSNRPDLPGGHFDWLDFVSKKAAHVSEFFILNLLSYRAFQRRYPDYSFLFTLLVAFSDETHQLFIPGRGAQLTDVIIDSTGILISSFLLWKRKST